MQRPGRLLAVVAVVVAITGAAAWALSSMPHVRFEDGVARVVGCDGAPPGEDCPLLFCTAALKNDPRVGTQARIEYTHFRNDPDGASWQMGLAHHPAAPAPGRGQLAVACRLAGTTVTEKLITEDVSIWER